MYRIRLLLTLLLAALLVANSTAVAFGRPFESAPTPSEAPDVTFEFSISPPANPDKSIGIGVGDTITVQVTITSDQPFLHAVAAMDAHYPGRGVFVQHRAMQRRGTEATLSLTVTGKAPTAGLWAVSDWYDHDSTEGSAPLAMVAGVRFQGGITASDAFPFFVVVE